MVTSCAAVLLLALLAAAHADPAPRIPSDLNQWVYTPGSPLGPQNLQGKNQKPMQRFWDRSVLEQANIVENFEQMRPLLDKLNAGQPITVVALGDSITANNGGCFHRDEEHRKRHVTLVDPQQIKGACNGMPLLWLSTFMQQINATWPHPDHLLVNLAKPGSVLMTWSDGECLEEYFPRQADLVVVEHLPALEGVNLTVLHAERLLHRLWLHMQAPLPAVIFLNMHPIIPFNGNWGLNSAPDKCVRNVQLCNKECPTYFQDKPDPRTMYTESELHTHAVASYYGLTSLSHAAVLHAITRDRWHERTQGLSECEAFGMLYADAVHPDPQGRLLMGDILVNFLAMAQRHLEAMAPTRTPGSVRLARSLPARPIEPESVTLYRSHCLYSARRVHEDALKGTANLHTMHMLKTEGWNFVEYDGEAKKYKPGWVATTPGSTLWIDVPLSLLADTSRRRVTLEAEGLPEHLPVTPSEDLRRHLGRVARRLGAQSAAPTQAPDPAWVQEVRLAELGGAEAAGGMVSAAADHPRRVLSSDVGIRFIMHLVFLRSYKHMGKANITCLEGCQCSHEVNGHNPNYHNSLPEIAWLQVYVPDINGKCVLEVKVLPETDSGEHKVKVIHMELGSYLNMTEQITTVARASRHSSKDS